jgi:hypothetical protein
MSVEWRGETGRTHKGGSGPGPLTHLIGRMVDEFERRPHERDRDPGMSEDEGLKEIAQGAADLGHTLTLEKVPDGWKAVIGSVTGRGLTRVEAAKRALRDSRALPRRD